MKKIISLTALMMILGTNLFAVDELFTINQNEKVQIFPGRGTTMHYEVCFDKYVTPVKDKQTYNVSEFYSAITGPALEGQIDFNITSNGKCLSIETKIADKRYLEQTDIVVTTEKDNVKMQLTMKGNQADPTLTAHKDYTLAKLSDSYEVTYEKNKTYFHELTNENLILKQKHGRYVVSDHYSVSMGNQFAGELEFNFNIAAQNGKKYLVINTKELNDDGINYSKTFLRVSENDKGVFVSFIMAGNQADARATSETFNPLARPGASRPGAVAVRAADMATARDRVAVFAPAAIKVPAASAAPKTK
ncbi:hypothetical protein AAIR98_001088 [Elusimicrobium simillimum]|uniref:hypothetical protein n=1 Tax=Elusimicrobium simillimum TaxID=3143438 RepID=UPI003C701F20